MKCFSGIWVLGFLLLNCPVCSAGEKPIGPELARINDSRVWRLINCEANASTEDGKAVVRLYPKGGNTKGSNIGLALVEGVEFTEGTLELDLRGRGAAQSSFVGVAFGAGDGKKYEAVYFRPFNFQQADPVRRAHAVQYISWPEQTWEKLRTRTPGKYESTVKPVPNPEEWFHARIEVTKKKVSVFLNDAKEPCLVVDRLGSAEKGKIGLWVDSQEGWFRGFANRAGSNFLGAACGESKSEGESTWTRCSLCRKIPAFPFPEAI